MPNQKNYIASCHYCNIQAEIVTGKDCHIGMFEKEMRIRVCEFVGSLNSGV